MTGPEVLRSLSRLLGSKIQSRIEFRHETTFTIQPEDLREVTKFCRDEMSFDYLIDISSVDNLGEEPRFEVVYELYSMTLAVHLRIKLAVSEGLARARDLRHDGDSFQQSPGSTADFDVGRLSILSTEKGFSAGRFAQ